MTSGIYAIINTINGKVYVGSTLNFEGRWDGHRGDLRKDTHCNLYLQRSWDKYGEDAFKFVVCEYVEDVGQLIDREQYWLDWHRLQTDVYNIALVTGRPPSRLGCETTGETKEKLRKASLGKQNALGCKRSQETRKRMSKGKCNMSPKAKAEWSDKIRKARIGKSSGMLGKKASKETRIRMSEAQMGHTVSKGTRQKIGDANRGRKLGPQSEEQRQKTSKALKAHWAKVREQNIT